MRGMATRGPYWSCDIAMTRLLAFLWCARCRMLSASMSNVKATAHRAPLGHGGGLAISFRLTGIRSSRERVSARGIPLAHGQAGNEIHYRINNDPVHHGRAGRNADERERVASELPRLVREADDLVVGQPDGLGELA